MNRLKTERLLIYEIRSLQQMHIRHHRAAHHAADDADPTLIGATDV